MVESTDIYVICSVPIAQQAIQQVFQMNSFNVEWRDALSGKATQGSKGKNLALGGFAQYYEQDFQIFVNPDQTLIIRLTKSTTGLAGGLFGAMKVTEKYQSIVNLVSMYFQTQGMYRGRNPP